MNTNPQSDSTPAQTIENITRYCIVSSQARGIWKRIDENRELLQFLREHEPEVLKRWSFIEGWIAGTDVFLVDLKNMLGLAEKPRGFEDRPFPRKWTGSKDISTWYGDTGYIPASRMISDALEGEQVTGKK